MVYHGKPHIILLAISTEGYRAPAHCGQGYFPPHVYGSNLNTQD